MSNSNTPHQAGIHAFQLHDLLEATGWSMSYQDAQEELGLTDRQMEAAFLVLREAVNNRKKHRQLSERHRRLSGDLYPSPTHPIASA